MANNGFLVDSPELAHSLAFGAGQDAANRQMRKRNDNLPRSRRKENPRWNKADAALACETTQKWYRHFNIMNSHQWMPEGYEWREVNGEWKPVRKDSATVAA